MLRIFTEVVCDEIGRLALEHVSGVLGERGQARLFNLLAGEAELSGEALVGDAWQSHLLQRIVDDDNPFSAKARRASLSAMGRALLEATAADLAELRHLFDHPLHVGELSPLGQRRPAAIKTEMARTSDWPAMIGPLADHFRQHGLGLLSHFQAFRWRSEGGTATLEGIALPDPVKLEELYTYDLERELLLANTEQFLAGHPANNVLLYGNRGTGKSSTVKALLNRYPELKMIELSAESLADLPLLLPQLASSPHRFILFVDDLSFDDFEVQFKHLKSLLEGGLEVRPSNVLIYATSNRRHLVKERFSDMTKAIINDEIHEQDSVEEKLSLSDRFGITLTFVTPDQQRYLQIVSAIARERGLSVSPEDLRARAVRWSMYHNGFSGRTARQFVDYLSAELALGRDASSSPI